MCLYIDDLIFIGNDQLMFEQLKKSMMIEFDMTNLGRMRYFLGIEILQRTYGIFIVNKSMLKRFWRGSI